MRLFRKDDARVSFRARKGRLGAGRHHLRGQVAGAVAQRSMFVTRIPAGRYVERSFWPETSETLVAAGSARPRSSLDGLCAGEARAALRSVPPPG